MSDTTTTTALPAPHAVSPLGRTTGTGKPSRDVTTRWLSDEVNDQGRVVITLEVGLSYRKTLDATVYVEHLDRGFYTRSFFIGAGGMSPDSATARISSEPMGRYSAKRVQAVADETMARVLAGDVPAEVAEILARIAR